MQDGLLEAVKEGDDVAGQVIGGVGDESAVVVEDDAELGGNGFVLVGVQSGTGGEVNHPEVVESGASKALWGTLSSRPTRRERRS